MLSFISRTKHGPYREPDDTPLLVVFAIPEKARTHEDCIQIICRNEKGKKKVEKKKRQKRKRPSKRGLKYEKMSQKTDDWPAHALFHVEISLKRETKKKRRRKKRLWLVQSSLARPRGLPDWRYLCKLSRRDEESSERARCGRMRMSLRMRLQGKKEDVINRKRSVKEHCRPTLT